MEKDRLRQDYKAKLVLTEQHFNQRMVRAIPSQFLFALIGYIEERNFFLFALPVGIHLCIYAAL